MSSSHYLSLDGASRLDGLLVAVHRVLTHSGPRGLSLRAVARANNMSPSSIGQHFGSWESALARVIWRTGAVRDRFLSSRVTFEGMTGVLPRSLDEVPFLRCWLTMVELGRFDEAVAEAVAPWLRAETDTLSRLVPAEDVDALQVVVDGLMVGLCRRETPLDLDRARMILTALVHEGLPSSDSGST